MQARMKAAAKETRPTSHGVECPADAGGDEEFAMRLVERQSVEALVAGELRGLR